MEEIIEEIPLTPLEPAKIYVHHFDKNTHEFLHKEEAEIDKQATKRLGYNVPLLPAYATLKLVPEYGENEIPVYSSRTEQQTVTEQIPVYDEETGEILSYKEQEKSVDILVEEWTVKPDYRKNFYKVDNNLNVFKIDTIGEQEGFYVVDKITGDLIKENPDKYKISDGNVIEKTEDEYEQEKAEKRMQDFYNNFIITSWGAFRKTPKGYSSAVEAVNTIFNMVNVSQSFTDQLANLLIFYEVPDFNDENQCTEEWLVSHQKTHEACDLQTFMQWYLEFQTVWAQTQYTDEEITEIQL